jgi:hypothetical protein
MGQSMCAVFFERPSPENRFNVITNTLGKFQNEMFLVISSFAVATFYFERRKPDDLEWIAVAGLAVPLSLSCVVSPRSRKAVSSLIRNIAQSAGKDITTKLSDRIATLVVTVISSVVGAMIVGVYSHKQ